MSEETTRLSYDEVLERRARALAGAVTATEESEVFAMIAVLVVGGTRLGVPVEHLAEVVKRTPVTSLPDLPPWFSGIAQIRGELMSVVHLGRWLGLRGVETGPFIAVLEGARGPLALEIDAVDGFRTVARHEIASDLGTETLKVPGLVRAVTKDLVLILDPQELLAHRDIVIEMEESWTTRQG